MGAKYSCQIVAGLLAAHGVRRVVLSPGSRNAPLIRAVRERRELKTLNVIDERSAAFVALGMAQVSREPVAVVCTSGTALLNYGPAVAEAYYQRVPLIVVSADRPAQWIDQDDSQTIRQPGALGNIVKFSCNLPDFSDPQGEMAWYARRQVNDALLAALEPAQGPVHINVQLGEPLTEEWPQLPELNIIRELRGEAVLPRERIRRLAREIADSRVMIVAGFMPPSDRMSRAVDKLSALPNVTVLAESMANLHGSRIFHCVDRMLTLVDDADERLRPQVVISVGGALVSRHLKAYLRGCRGLQHWSVGMNEISADVFKHLSLRVKMEPAEFLSALADALVHEEIESSYAADWRALLPADEVRHQRMVESAPWSSLKAFSLFWPEIPVRTNVQLSNGTCVRYAQLFHNPEVHACYCNRGVSGIDGCTSTAVGAAEVYHPGKTLLITGDMSFAYDLNALQIKETGALKIIVINNGGGGIFRFIRSTRNLPEREENFCVNPGVDIPGVAALNGYSLFRAGSEAELLSALPEFFGSREKALLEIVVDPEPDAEAITEYFRKNCN